MRQDLSFSIVTPSFNQGAFIGEALESVHTQHWKNIEHVVMDGGSTDGTPGVLTRYSARHDWEHLRWKSEPDRGQSHALNKGFAAATGDIVGWLNSDDRYLPLCFERVASAFEQHPDVDILYGDYRFVDESGKAQRIRREIEFSQFVLLYHRVLYIPTTTTFFRRRVFDEGHFLDERLHFALDAEFLVRLARNGFRFQHLRALLADFRFQPNSKTCSSPQKQIEEKRRIMEDYSSLLRAMPWPAARRGVRSLLSSSAAALRYSEKLLRGCYLEERWSSQLHGSS
jgi:glycosyltransferase involved in cell wall biosynthesis